MKHLVSLFATLLFWGFIVVKVAGHTFAAWSWWWVLMPIVPWLSLLLITYWGL